MKIGIYLDNWDERAGGGHSYTKTVVEYFTSVTSNHEFLFIVNSATNGLPESYSSLSNFILYNPFNTINDEEQQNKRDIKNLKRFLGICNFLIHRIKLNSVKFFRD